MHHIYRELILGFRGSQAQQHIAPKEGTEDSLAKPGEEPVYTVFILPLGHTTLAACVSRGSAVLRLNHPVFAKSPGRLFCRADSSICWRKTPLPHGSKPLGENEVSDATETAVMPLLRVEPGLGSRQRLRSGCQRGLKNRCVRPRCACLRDAHHRRRRRSERACGWESQQCWATRGWQILRPSWVTSALPTLRFRVWDPCGNPRRQPNDWNLHPRSEWQGAGPGGSEDSINDPNVLFNGPNVRERLSQPTNAPSQHASQPLC